MSIVPLFCIDLIFTTITRSFMPGKAQKIRKPQGILFLQKYHNTVNFPVFMLSEVQNIRKLDSL